MTAADDQPPHYSTRSFSGDLGPRPWNARAIKVVAVCWSVFQLSLASFVILDSVVVRAVHLGFAMAMALLGYPLLKGRLRAVFYSLAWRKLATALSILVAALGVFAAIYIILDYEGLNRRLGAPSVIDVLVGVLLLVLLLEAARRVVGPALPLISLAFLLYALFGNHMPDFLAFKGVSLGRLVGQMTMSTEGVYGIPLDVSANVVFLFVLFGAMLEKAGAGSYFIQMALSVMGRFKGGPAKAAVLASGLTGMVSGSSIANVVTTGTFTIPLMKKVGYPPTKAAAVEVAASIDGQLMPPIMGAAAFVIAEYVNVPYIEVMKAALIPALVSYTALLYITHVEACKLGIRGLSREEAPRFLEVLPQGLQYLIPIFVLVGELIYFRHSPQMAVFRAIVALALILCMQYAVEAFRSGLSVLHGVARCGRVLLESLATGAVNMVPVAIATASAGIVVGVVTLGLGGLVTEVIDQLSGGSVYAMLSFTALACLIVGMGLPTTATYIVMASLTVPALLSLAESNGLVIPLIAAHLFCFYFGILADDTPPVGLASYAAAAIARSDPIPTGLQGFMYDIRTAIIPFMFIFNHQLLLKGVNSIAHGVLVFATAALGATAFVSATQGWFLIANRWYEIPILLGVTVLMFRPDLLASWWGLSHHYFSFVAGIALYVLVYLLQRHRAERSSI